MFKSTKSVGIMALITLILLVAFMVVYFTTKETVEVDAATGTTKVKRHIFGMGATPEALPPVTTPAGK